VAALDYCGHSIATAAGASYLAPAARAEKKVQSGAHLKKKAAAGKVEIPSDSYEGEERPGAAPVTLYLAVEREHLTMTFVRSKQVLLDRTLQRGADWSGDLSEVLMAMEYYESMNPDRLDSLSGVLCGSDTSGELAQEAADFLGVPFRLGHGAEWALCSGASRTDLDFGRADLNSTVKTGRVSRGWQYILILAGGAALVGVLLFTMGHRLSWAADINRLQTQAGSLRIQMVQAGEDAAVYEEYAQNYENYRMAYADYVTDWETIFGNLHTYNDNLSKVLGELERVLPQSSTVMEIGIAEEGMSLVLACPDKEEAAYDIITLRGLRYADLVDIADLGYAGAHTSPAEMLPTLYEWVTQQNTDALTETLMREMLGVGADDPITLSAEEQEAMLEEIRGILGAYEGESAPTEGGRSDQSHPGEAGGIRR